LPINGVRDYTCGYRAYRASIIKLAIKKYGDNFINRDGFEVMVDILLKLGDMKIVFGEVPLILRYDRKENPSSMNVMQTIKSSLLLLVQRVYLKGKVPV
jgi:dolichol-phosphate mannosyltransferase